jgi:hypothetical protein
MNFPFEDDTSSSKDGSYHYFQYIILFFCFAFSYASGVLEVESVHHWAGYPSKKVKEK